MKMVTKKGFIVKKLVNPWISSSSGLFFKSGHSLIAFLWNFYSICPIETVTKKMIQTFWSVAALSVIFRKKCMKYTVIIRFSAFK